MRPTANDIAKLIIRSGNDVSNLKLQKLLYYVQGWHLAIHGERLFDETIEAWQHGPVVPKVYRDYKHYGWKAIPDDGSDLDVEESVKEHIADVLTAYGSLGAISLEQLTHSEPPWKAARNGLHSTASCSREITEASMREYFTSVLPSA